MKKSSILYIIGLVGLSTGIILKLFTGFGLLISFASLLFIIIVFIASKLINASKDSTNDSDDGYQLEMKVQNALNKARQDKFKANNDIKKISMWANDLIYITYEQLFKDNNEYKKEQLLANYDKIYSQYNEKIAFEEADKCDNLIKAYNGEIELLETKIKIYDKLHNQYSDMRVKLKEAKQKEKRMQQINRKADQLKEIQQNNSAAITGEYEQEFTYENLKKEVELKDEYYTQLQQLEYEFSSEPAPNKAIESQNIANQILEKL